MIDSLIDREVFTTHDSDPLENFIVDFEYNPISDSSDVANICAIFDNTQDYSTRAWQPKFEEFLEKNEKQIPSSGQVTKVNLKPCHPPVKFEYRVYWANKRFVFDPGGIVQEVEDSPVVNLVYQL